MAGRALDIEGERDILRGADELLPRAADLHQALLLEAGKAGPYPLRICAWEMRPVTTWCRTRAVPLSMLSSRARRPPARSP